MMKLLVLADIHGDETVLDKLRELKKEKFDHVLIAGDSTENSVPFMRELLEIFPDAYIIPGNNESNEVMEIMREARNYSHGKRLEIGDDYNVVGFGFSNPTPFNTPNELADKEIYGMMKELYIDEKTILLVHAPPYGIQDEIKGRCIGSRAIRKVIEEKKPFLVFCGHLHETSGSGLLGKTLVVKVPCGEKWKFCTVEISDGKANAEFKNF